MAGDLDALESRLDDAEAALAEGAQDPDLAATWADTDELRTAPATISVYRASLAQARGDTDGTVRHARRVMELAGPEDHFLRGAGGGFLGLAAFAAGDLQEALATFSEAMRSLHAAGNLVDELDGTIEPRGHVDRRWAGPAAPGGCTSRRCGPPSGEASPHLRATADMHVGLAELDRELDDLSSAEAHLETARVLSERTSITENRHRRLVAMAQVRAARGDYDAALRLLDEAEELYRPGFYPDVRPIAAMRARVQIAVGDLTAAAELGGRARARRRRRAGLPARVRPPDAGAARARPAPRRCGQCLPGHRRAGPARTAAHSSHGRPGGTAAFSRSGC